MIEDDTKERFVSTSESPPMYIGEVEEMRARDMRYVDMRMRLVALRRLLIAEFYDLKIEAESDGPGLKSFVSLSARATAHNDFAHRIQNILDGRDP